MLDFKNLEACAALVTERTGLNPSDLAGLLVLSAGTTTDVDGNVTIHHRPYYVAAGLLNERRDQATNLPKGIVLDTQTSPKALMRRQAGLDAALGLTVPKGMEAGGGVVF